MSWNASLALAREVALRRGGDTDIRVWVPACGNGRDAYELVAALTEVLGPQEVLSRAQVCATDPSTRAVRDARAGLAAAVDVTDLPESVAERYFPDTGGGRVFTEDLRSVVSFARHDLTRDRAVRRLDLIDARGWSAARWQGTALAGSLAASLRPGGLLAADEVPGEPNLDLLPVRGVTGLWERPADAGAGASTPAWRPSEPLRIVVVDEHQLYARGLATLVQSLFGRFVTVVGISSSADDAVELVARERPDMVLVDVSSPSAAALPSAIRDGADGVPILALTEDTHEAWRDVLAGGCSGVVSRSVSADGLVGPLLAVAEGLTVLPPEAVQAMGRGVPAEQLDLLDRLEDAELELWAWVAQGLQDNEIAEALFVSARTVKRRVGALLRRLGVQRRIEAAELAGRLGLLARMGNANDRGPEAVGASLRGA